MVRDCDVLLDKSLFWVQEMYESLEELFGEYLSMHWLWYLSFRVLFLNRLLKFSYLLPNSTNGCTSKTFSRQRITAGAQVLKAGERETATKLLLSRHCFVHCLLISCCYGTLFLLSGIVTDTLGFRNLQGTIIMIQADVSCITKARDMDLFEANLWFPSIWSWFQDFAQQQTSMILLIVLNNYSPCCSTFSNLNLTSIHLPAIGFCDAFSCYRAIYNQISLLLLDTFSQAKQSWVGEMYLTHCP